MNNHFDYQVIECHLNHHPVLQTIGLYDLMGIELCMHLVISKPLARGLMTQIINHYLTLVDHPSLFNDPWIHYVFEENRTLCLISFVLLKEDDICYIIIPDSAGLYPWQFGCEELFKKQVSETLIISNLLAAIKAAYLTRLMYAVAIKVYANIGFSIDLDHMPLEDIPDFLAEKNLDMYIVLTLCFNKSMPQINQHILEACHSIPMDITHLNHPLTIASQIVSRIYNASLEDQFTLTVMHTFYKLNKL